METNTKSNGAFIGLTIIVIILIIGGIYMWKANEKRVTEIQAQNEALTKADADALDALVKDITTTDTNVGVDANTVK